MNNILLSQHFTEMLEQSQIVALSTGFKQLDGLLNGGLFPCLYVLGGVSSIGKTSFALQIADYIVANNRDVLYFNIEQSSTELFAKSLSRKTYEMKNGLSASAILYDWKSLTDTQKQAVQEAQNSFYKAPDEFFDGYVKEAPCLYYYDKIASIKDIENELGGADTLAISPVVIVDYLQLLKAPDDMVRATDKQVADFTIAKLKELCNSYRVPIIAISSFNRESYSKEVAMNAFKESGAIEYSSDVLIGLQYQGQNSKFDFDKAKNANPRKVEAVILKNRMGKLGKQAFDYYPEYNYFKEVKK